MGLAWRDIYDRDRGVGELPPNLIATRLVADQRFGNNFCYPCYEFFGFIKEKPLVIRRLKQSTMARGISTYERKPVG
ncbi:MAG: hypothetical protein ACRD4Q_05510 [Candidatus Acidiferrales bacterium]